MSFSHAVVLATSIISLVLFGPTRLAIADVTLDGRNTTQPNLTLSTATGLEIREAIQAFGDGKIALCEELLGKARAANKDLPDVQMMMAVLAMDSGRMGDSIQRAERYLVSHSSGDPMPYLVLGEVAQRSGRWTDAHLQLDRAQAELATATLSDRRRRDLSLRLLQLQAENAERRQQYDEANLLYSDWSSRDAKAAVPIWALGRIRIAKGEQKDALENFKAARELDPQLPQPELAIALQVAQQSDVSDKQAAKDIESWFQASIKAKDSAAANWSEYFKWLLQVDRPQDVLRMVDKLSDDTMKLRDMQLLKGIASRATNDLAGAETIFSSLHQGNSEDLEAADQLALVLVEQSDEGKRARAAQLSEATLRRAPNNEVFVATAAWVQFKLGSIDIADRMLGELASKIAISPQTAYYVASLLKAKGHDKESALIIDSLKNTKGIVVQRFAMQSAK